MQWKSGEPIGLSKYEISEYGHVRNIRRGTIVRTHDNQYGDTYVQMYNDEGGRTSYIIGKLVAELYITDPTNQKTNEKSWVVHKDYDQDNNHYTNLVWRSRSYLYRYNDQKNLEIEGDLAQPVFSVDFNRGGKREFFETVYEASMHYGMLMVEILYCLDSGEESTSSPGVYFED